MAKQVTTKHYNSFITEAFEGRETVTEGLSLVEALNEVLEWHGLIGYTSYILNAIENLKENGHK